MSDDSSALIQLGFVGAPFGVRGWVKLRSHTNPPERLLEHGNLQIGREGAWRSYRIEQRGRSGGALTVKLAGVEDRDQAAALTGTAATLALKPNESGALVVSDESCTQPAVATQLVAAIAGSAAVLALSGQYKVCAPTVTPLAAG